MISRKWKQKAYISGTSIVYKHAKNMFTTMQNLEITKNHIYVVLKYFVNHHLKFPITFEL